MNPQSVNAAPPQAGPTRRSVAAGALLDGTAALTTSFRMHRPRGAFCHDGWCQQCKVTLSDGRVVLACQEPAGRALRDGGTLRQKCLRLLGRLAERQPPWFYEGSFLRPKDWRQVYLNVLRHLSGAKSLPERPPAPGTPWRRASCDVLVVGGGAAGRAAAAELARHGRSVIVVDARAAPPPDAAGHSEAAYKAFAQTLCVGLYEGPRRALCVDDAGSMLVEHRELVVATGAYDRILPFANNDLPGIVGVRALERLAAQDALAHSLQVGVYGERAEVARAMDALAAAGLTPKWVAGPGALPGTAPGIESHPDAALIAARGSRRVEGVELSGIGVRRCDLLVLGFSQPGYELQLQRQARLHAQGLPRKLVPDVAGTGMLVVGEAAGDADAATADEDARRRVRTWLETNESPPHRVDAPVHEPCRRQHPDAFICPCEDVRVSDIRAAIAEGYDDIELIKRHTGAATGPCQGKLCHANLMDCLAEQGVEPRLPTQRPLVRPVPFARFAGAEDE
jgi:sarcosine oxidase subunit alpha